MLLTCSGPLPRRRGQQMQRQKRWTSWGFEDSNVGIDQKPGTRSGVHLYEDALDATTWGHCRDSKVLAPKPYRSGTWGSTLPPTRITVNDWLPHRSTPCHRGDVSDWCRRRAHRVVATVNAHEHLTARETIAPFVSPTFAFTTCSFRAGTLHYHSEASLTSRYKYRATSRDAAVERP